MLSLFSSDVLLDVIIRRAIFSVFTGTLWLLIAIGIIRLLKVRNPAVKHILYALVLSKGFVALIREQPSLIQNQGSIIVGIQFPSPWKILPNFPDLGESFSSGSSTIAAGPGVAVLALALMFLLWRFVAFLRFERIISKAPEVDRRSNEAFFAILDRLVERTRVAYPKVILVNSSDAPFTVGLKRPVIALSPVLLKQLVDDEIEAILAHEVAHIARWDHLYHWPLVVMRDVLFFNPFTRSIYDRLSFERERACDDFSAKMSEPLTMARSLVRVAEIKTASPTVGLVRSFAPQSFLANRESNFSRRVIELIEPKPYAPQSRRGRAVLLLGFIIFFYLEIHIIAFINGTQIILS